MKIDRVTMSILEMCSVNETNIHLPEVHLERALYLKVAKVLKMMGGKWNRGKKAHVFSEDPADLLDQTLMTEEVISLANELQYFPTPASIVDGMLAQAILRLQIGDAILEPSAGEGAIAIPFAEAGFKVTVCEKHLPFVKKLSEKNITVLPQRDFLDVEPCELFDAVIANPPFTKQQDIAHVSHMVDFVKERGLLMSVMSNGITFRQDKKTQALMEKLDCECSEWDLEQMEAGSFKKSGTMVSTVMLTCLK